MVRTGSLNEIVMDLSLGTLTLLSAGSKITDGDWLSCVIKVTLCAEIALFKESSAPALIAT